MKTAVGFLAAGLAIASTGFAQDPYSVAPRDGGPVLFKHEHGESGAMAATRPATRGSPAANE
jgi:hypothetical protein